MATHSSVLAWRIPGMGEPVGLPSMGPQSWTRLKRLSRGSSSSSSSRGDQAPQKEAGFLFFFKISFPIIISHRILNMLKVPCAVQQDLVIDPLSTSLHLLIPASRSIPPLTLSPLAHHKFVLYECFCFAETYLRSHRRVISYGIVFPTYFTCYNMDAARDYHTKGNQISGRDGEIGTRE